MRMLDELGYYLLAGAGGDGPATLVDEARRGEELGFGTAFISERWNVKEAASLTGAACAVTARMQIATAATNHNTRHPLISGSWATTMHRLSGGRFTLGIGRGIGAIYAAYGIPAVTTAQMEDFAQVMRRLWRGEVIFNHDGPIGKYPILVLDPDIVPSSTYVVVAECGIYVSDPGSGSTALWGDIVGDFIGGAWTPPNGVVDFNDITATVDGFRHVPSAPSEELTDVHPCHPEGVIDFMDIRWIVDAFLGDPYPCAIPCP